MEEYEQRHRDGVRTMYRTDVRYVLRRDGEEYVGRGVHLEPRAASVRSWMEGEARRYPVGREVVVHYDPARPARTCLEPESGAGVGLAVTGLGAAVALGAMGWTLFHR